MATINNDVCQYEHENTDGTIELCEELASGRTLNVDLGDGVEILIDYCVRPEIQQEVKNMREGQHTLWGPAQTVKELVPGIWVVSTASHGGVFVEPEKWESMPEYMRRTPYSQGGYFEEDCDWCLPFVVFEVELRQSTDPHTLEILNRGWHTETFKESYHTDRFVKWERAHPPLTMA